MNYEVHPLRSTEVQRACRPCWRKKGMVRKAEIVINGVGLCGDCEFEWKLRGLREFTVERPVERPEQ